MNTVIEPIVKCAAGLDVHQGSVTCTVLEEESTGVPRREARQYTTFPRRLKELGRWLKPLFPGG
ncbi:MAG: hypothetical protein NTW80_10290 [Deltaproteobacteria bacterium]|nr:hypothetical protein [Deltaproteobacteria bacterium]